MTFARLTSDATCAVLYAVSFGITLGIVAAACTNRLMPALLTALLGIVAALAAFGRSVWRGHRRRTQQQFLSRAY